MSVFIVPNIWTSQEKKKNEKKKKEEVGNEVNEKKNQKIPMVAWNQYIYIYIYIWRETTLQLRIKQKVNEKAQANSLQVLVNISLQR